ncbi:MAG: sodium:alanine symporter family protein, partial [Bosea sp.]|nr:sodium:alanine symporter family protein [Bosea sp. (in: a-proteobacteria)]
MTVGDVSIPLIVVWLVAGGLYFTFYLRFLPARALGVAIDIVRGKYDDPDDKGEVSHFQALATALSGTVGIGNIGGVAVAVTAGGPGAIFWMVLAGVLGMSSKLAECTLAVKYRKENPDGTISGGPMYFLEYGLKERNLGGLGKSLGVFYAVAIIFGCVGGGNMFQSNQAYEQFVLVTGGDASWFADKAWLFGLILAVAVGVVIIGGIQGIAKVTEKLVPGMALLYVATGLVILAMNADKIPGAVGMIIGGAFAPKAVAGGAIGALIQG